MPNFRTNQKCTKILIFTKYYLNTKPIKATQVSKSVLQSTQMNLKKNTDFELASIY